MKPNFETRRDKLRRSVKKLSADGILITDEINVTYLTGFTGDSSYLLLTQKGAIVLSDSRYTSQLEEECPGLDFEIRDSRVTMMSMLGKTLSKMGVQSLAFEGDAYSKSGYDKLESSIPDITLVQTSGLVEDLRQIKDKYEVSEIERSIGMAQRAFEVIRHSMTPNQTEAEIAHNLEHQIRAYGGDKCAFEPIVGVGPRAALPHAIKTDRQIGESPFVLIDWGAKAGQYMSDLTRVLVTGKLSSKLDKIYNIVLKAQLAAIDKIKPGVSMDVVDSAARGLIAKSGYGKKFGHGLGHGFGLQIHENPRISPGNTDLIQAGMVITIEPGIYLPGWGGVRIEDDILVTSDGHRVLTSTPKNLEEMVVQF